MHKWPVSQAGSGRLRSVRIGPGARVPRRACMDARDWVLFPVVASFARNLTSDCDPWGVTEAMYARDPRRALLHSRALSQRTMFTGGGSQTLPPQLPGSDRRRPGDLGAVGHERVVHAPPLASPASLARFTRSPHCRPVRARSPRARSLPFAVRRKYASRAWCTSSSRDPRVGTVI